MSNKLTQTCTGAIDYCEHVHFSHKRLDAFMNAFVLAIDTANSARILAEYQE